MYIPNDFSLSILQMRTTPQKHAAPILSLRADPRIAHYNITCPSHVELEAGGEREATQTFVAIRRRSLRKPHVAVAASSLILNVRP